MVLYNTPSMLTVTPWEPLTYTLTTNQTIVHPLELDLFEADAVTAISSENLYVASSSHHTILRYRLSDDEGLGTCVL